MLTPVKTRKWNARESEFAIVASRYNARYVDAMLQAAVPSARLPLPQAATREQTGFARWRGPAE